MSKTVTAKNFINTMGAIIGKFEQSDPTGKKLWAEAMNEFLDDLLAQDFFGTEGQNDPRGDRRND